LRCSPYLFFRKILNALIISIILYFEVVHGSLKRVK
jgi:hypothetical protein